ncbi:hypothetical protein B1759_16540 [Rubrivirga sp. SAORIC476]|uniref:hypothetical protein n=1 Tax=Rubrivirga sp. SAORIC476 TaxID=1961794 RepID=UPI000BA9501D|nr:hypothetical protein [Rubrivirga sp. SAORIC476]PAP74787.1 hypothetical protein B1759_16540 [Rubrivirga sp. SAORIC476]
MAVYRVDVLAAEPQPVFDWIKANVPEDQVVRVVAFESVKGHYFKCVFRRQSDAELFNRWWRPEVEDPTVNPFGHGPWPTPSIAERRAVEPTAAGRRRAPAFLRWFGFGVYVALTTVLPSALRG